MPVNARRDAAADTLNLLDDAARMLLGDVGGLTDQERGYISRPLSRQYQRAPAVAETVSAWADPVMIVAGLLLWSLRIFAVWQQQRAYRRYQLERAAEHAAEHGPDIQTRVGLAPDEAPPAPENNVLSPEIVSLFARNG